MDNPRLVAALATADVLAGRALNESLEKRVVSLTRQDQALAAEIAYGTCRWFFRLDFIARQLLNKGFKPRDNDIRALLLTGLYQLQYTRIPAHAAVGETAGIARLLKKKWAVPVINGVLRRFQRETEKLTGLADADPQSRYALPGWLVTALRKDWPQQWEGISAALLERPPMALRVNLARTSRKSFLQRLDDQGLTACAHELVSSACVLEEPVPVEKLPGFFDGDVSVQDAGAQLASGLLDVKEGHRVLDACAAPGGKTGHLLESVADLDVTAVDVEARRLERVAENLQRLGQSATLVAGDAIHPQGPWSEQRYQRILLDAPCSATGVIRRHPDIKLLRRAQDIPVLVEKQQQLLQSMWGLLEPGGKLLYVTCSVLMEENRMQVQRFIYNNHDAVLEKLPWLMAVDDFGDIQIAPGFQGMDGFYYALLNKK